jgi:hypothetical protein
MRRPTLIFLVVLLGLFVSLPMTASTFAGVMLGSNEVPPNASPATGFSAVTVMGDTLTVDVSWSGLMGGNPGAAHIHCCVTPGNNVNVAIPYTSFPSTTSGTYIHTFDLLDASIYTMNFLTNFGGGTAMGARDALIAGLEAGEAYSNIHNAVYPGGEIRADLAQIPEPSSVLLMGAGLLGIAAYARRRIV